MPETTGTKNPLLPPDLPEYSHSETTHGRMTVINNTEKVKKLIEVGDEPGTITLKYPDPTPENPENEFAIKLTGFAKIADAAGDEVLYIKEKAEENLLVFLLTKHPDSRRALTELRIALIKNGLERVVFQNIEDTIKEMMAQCKSIMAGTIKPEPGVHPKMEYVKEDYK